MTVEMVIDLGRQTIQLILLLSTPPLLAGLVVGFVIGLFQAATQIHEMTLTVIPKILAIFALLFLLLPWMVTTLLDFTTTLFLNLESFVR